jgi:hypothetical protein
MRRSTWRCLAGGLGLVLAADVRAGAGSGDDAPVRRALREAARAVDAQPGTGSTLDRASRAWTYVVLAEAQASVGDDEGARLSRERAGAASTAFDESRKLDGLVRRAGDRARDDFRAEAVAAYEQAAKLALAPEAGSVRVGARPKGLGRGEVVAAGAEVASALAKAREVEAARRVLRAAREVAGTGRGVDDLFAVARAFAALGDKDDARATLAEAERRVAAVDEPETKLDLLHAVIAARWSLGDKDAARTAYKQALGLVRVLPVERFAPSNAACALPPMLATMGDFEGAFRIIAEDIPLPHRGYVVGRVVETVARAAGLDLPAGSVSGAAAGAGWGWGQVQVRDSEPPAEPPIDRETARRALRLAARAADGVWWQRDRGGQLAAVARLQAQLGDVDGAKQSTDTLADRARDDDDARALWAGALAEVAGARLRAGDRDGAEAGFETAARAALALPERSFRRGRFRWGPESYPRATALRLIARARAEAGDLDGLLRTAEQIDDPALRAQALADAARARLRAGDRDGALRIAEAPGHGFPSIAVLAEVADVKAKAGDRDGARAVRRRALAEAEDYLERRPDDPTVLPYDPSASPAAPVNHWDLLVEGRGPASRLQAGAALQVAALRRALGDAAGALRAAESVADEDLREAALPPYLAAQVEAGDAPAAFARALRFRSLPLRAAAIEELAGAVARLNGPADPPPDRP